MLELLKKDLEEKGVFNGKLPSVLTQVTKSISAPYLPERMKMTIAVAGIMLYAGHFRRNIELWNKAIIPVNGISFSIAKSGAGKDKAVGEVKKCFTKGYNKLEVKRKELAKQAAIQLAANDGVENPTEFEAYKEFYKPPATLFTAVTNSAAFLAHVAELEESGIGAGYIYAGELGSELQTNSDMMTTIKDIAELYDQGGKEAKVLKDKLNQTSTIDCMPVSALFVGAPDNILYNEQNKRKFKDEFSTKMARRSFFNYSPEEIKGASFPSVSDLVAFKTNLEDVALATREATDSTISDLTDYQLQHLNETIKVSPEVRILFETYLEYNREVSDGMSKLYPISQLVRLHLQWKALKLAGAVAFFNKNESITASDYIEAINFVELLDRDMEVFESELVKEPYELFVSYMHSIAQDNKANLGLHQLRKLGYIPTTGKPEQRLKELVNLASSYDKTGIYTCCNEGVCFERIVKTNGNGISYVSVSGSKEERFRRCAEGFKFAEVQFEALGEMLTKDWAYTPFTFKDGVRGKDNIIGGCKWVCLDVDRSHITDKEAHEILQNINHHIVRTSDETNEFKFRVLLELDSIVDVPDKVWKPFIKSISESLGITSDLLPKSQVYFSYSGREVFSVTNKNPIEVKNHVLYAHNYAADRPDIVKYTKAQKEALLSDRLTTFDYAFDAEQGGRSLALIRAAKHAFHSLGLGKEDTKELVLEINDYWVVPLGETRLQTTILNQIDRW